MKMAKFCKNCGAYISENDAFCTDCGKSTLKTCPKCREQLTAHSKFCPNCGYEIKSSRLPIIIAALAVIAIVAAITISPITITSMQEVQVDTFTFNIPDNFEENPASELYVSGRVFLVAGKGEEGYNFIVSGFSRVDTCRGEKQDSNRT